MTKFLKNSFCFKFELKKPGRTKIKTPIINITDNNLSIKKAPIKVLFWCGRRDSNSHELSSHGPQPCLSTNFSTTAICPIINE